MREIPLKQYTKTQVLATKNVIAYHSIVATILILKFKFEILQYNYTLEYIVLLLAALW